MLYSLFKIAPTTSTAIRLLRVAINKLSKEFEEQIKLEREGVKKLGKIYIYIYIIYI